MVYVLEGPRPSDYLTRLAASDLGRGYKRLVLDAMACPLGGRVVDLGCGPGADLVGLADAVGPSGRVLGIDADPSAVAAASRQTVGLPQVTVTRGDVHHLDLPDESVDGVHTDRVLQHVVDPAAVVREAARVLRARGVAVFAEPDWDTLVLDGPDLAIPDAYRRFVTAEVVRNSRIGRQLPGLCTRSGLRVDGVIPVTAVFLDVADADRILGFHRVTRSAVAAGYLTADEGAAWLEHLSSDAFFASVTLFVTVARGRPDPAPQSSNMATTGISTVSTPSTDCSSGLAGSTWST